MQRKIRSTIVYVERWIRQDCLAHQFQPWQPWHTWVAIVLPSLLPVRNTKYDPQPSTCWLRKYQHWLHLRAKPHPWNKTTVDQRQEQYPSMLGNGMQRKHQVRQKYNRRQIPMACQECWTSCIRNSGMLPVGWSGWSNPFQVQHRSLHKHRQYMEHDRTLLSTVSFCEQLAYSLSRGSHLPFHKWYKLVPLGLVPTSSKIHTLGFNKGAKALKNHLCELSFLAFFSLRQNMIWIGTLPLSEPKILPVSLSTMTCEVYS